MRRGRNGKQPRNKTKRTARRGSCVARNKAGKRCVRHTNHRGWHFLEERRQPWRQTDCDHTSAFLFSELPFKCVLRTGHRTRHLMRVAAALVAILLATPALASQTCTMTLPEECRRIVSSEFSTGGGGTMLFQMEVLCRLDAKRHRTYIATYVSGGAALAQMAGFGSAGRLSAPWHVDIVTGDVKHAEIECR